MDDKELMDAWFKEIKEIGEKSKKHSADTEKIIIGGKIMLKENLEKQAKEFGISLENSKTNEDRANETVTQTPPIQENNETR